MRTLLAALLLAPAIAGAACFQHPDSGATYCTSSAECPVGTAWGPISQLCAPAATTQATPACTGVGSGTTTTMPLWALNVRAVSTNIAHWTRIGPVVSVAGATNLVAEQAGLVQLYLLPPIDTEFTTHFQAAGVMTTRSGDTAEIVSVPVAREVRLAWEGPGALVNDSVRYVYTYRISECP